MRQLAICFLVLFAGAMYGPASTLADPPAPVPIPVRSVGAVAERPDGGVVVAGHTGYCLGASDVARPCRDRRVYLAEFDPRGHLVRSFGGEWPSRLLGGVRAIALGSGGDIYLAGKSNGGARVAHFAPDGQPDAGFGAGGVVRFQEVGDRVFPTLEGLAITPDGGVIAAGSVRTVAGRQEVLLLRIEPDGSLDSGFGSGGAVLTPAAPGPRLGPGDANAVALMGDGRIVVAGSTEHSYKRRSALFAARYLPDGELDPSFGVQGQSSVAASAIRTLSEESLGVLADGTVVLAGRDYGPQSVADRSCVWPVVVRLRPDGSPDPNFGGGPDGAEPGVLDAGPRVGSPCGAGAATVLGDGGVAFTLFGEDDASVFAGRLTSDGSPTPGFARPGSAALTPPRGGFLWNFKLATGGEVTAGEMARPFDHGRFLSHSAIIVARDANGRLRRGFGTNGTVVFPPDGL
jgi:uncharacterized delta-60 repeat protein